MQLPLTSPELAFEATGGTLVRRTLLPSGVRVLTESVPSAQSVSIGVSVSVGSRDETGGHYGSTHFLEHLLFKGTPTRSALDIASSFDSVGASSNAATAKEYTSYYARIQSSSLELAVSVLVDMVTSSVLNADEFKLEKTVILEELAMTSDDPEDVAHEAFAESVLGNHALGRPIGGTPETITAVSRDAVWEHYQQNYRPNDLVITAAGGVDHDYLLELVQRYLVIAGWDLSLSAVPTRRNQGVAKIEPPVGFRSVKKETSQANILLGTQGLSANDPDRYALGILNTVLGGGMSSRLFQEVREKRGLAYSVYSFNQGYSDAGIFALYAGCSNSKTSEVIQIMAAELEKIASNGITEAELGSARGNVSGGLALRFESSQARMNRLLAAEIAMGEFLDLEQTLKLFNEVENDDVKRVAQRLVQQPQSLVVVGEADYSNLAALVG